MKIIFFGSSHYSRSLLEALYKKGWQISAIVTAPAKPAGRGLHLKDTIVAQFAKENQLDCYTPHTLQDQGVVDKLSQYKADIFVIASYGNIIPEKLLSLPALFPLGVHPSLLPRYRGPAPIPWVLINGEKQTGVTLFKVTKKVDAGEILLQKEIIIDSEDDIFTLEEKLTSLSKKLLLDGLQLICDNKYTFLAQNEQEATYTRKITKKDGLINWAEDSELILRKVRALKKWPVAYTFLGNKLLKIFEGRVKQSQEIKNILPGTIISTNNGIEVYTGKGIFIIDRLQPEGKRIMSSSAFVCGYHISPGMKFKDS